MWYGKISCPEHHFHDMGVFSSLLFYKYLHIDYNTVLKSLQKEYKFMVILFLFMKTLTMDNF